MKIPPKPPDLLADTSLESALGRALSTQNVHLIRRTANTYASTYYSEIITFTVPTGESVKVFCKYNLSPNPGELDIHTQNGNRGGVTYEAFIYSTFLRSSEHTVPSYFGTLTDAGGQELGIMLEFLEGATKLFKAERWRERLFRAVEWIARFHAQQSPDGRQFSSRVHRYDEAYFQRLSDKASRVVKYRLGDTQGWLQPFAYPRADWFKPLIEGVESHTLIHGEYYPSNLLVKENTLYPVDWETAAFAAGEIDLAALTEGLSESDREECETMYCRIRWPGGVPSHFKDRLAAAQQYLVFQWLSDDKRRMTRGRSEKIIKVLRYQAEQIGLFES